MKRYFLKFSLCCFLGFCYSISVYSQIGEGLQEWAEEVASIYAEETEIEDVSEYVAGTLLFLS